MMRAGTPGKTGTVPERTTGFGTLLTVAGNTPAAIGRLVRKTRGR